MSSNKNDPSRRDILAGVGATLGAAALGCGGSASAGGPDAGATGDAALPDADPMEQWTDKSDAGARELLKHIDTYVVLCMENRSFDHYLGSLSLLEGRGDIDGLTGNESNPGSHGGPVGVHVLEDFTPADPPHNWEACHAQWNGGANDGFVLAHAGKHETDVMGYHVREQLPVMYALADGSAICHRWHSALLGPTWPNRFYLHGGTSRGVKSNRPLLLGYRSIFSLLDDAAISHTNYYHDVAWATVAYGKLTGLAGIEEYFDAAAAGTLPSVCMLDPKFLGAGANDDHPDHDIRLGQALIGSVYTALAQSPQWERSLFIVTYDEHGGFYDHVAPPRTRDELGDFRQLGFRVPALVAGPTVRRGAAIDTTFEHCSVVATLTRRFGLEVVNDRVAETADLSSCIDPALLGNPQPGPTVPPVEISLRAIERRPVTNTHPEMVSALARRAMPREVDRRGRDREVTRLWLERAARIGAVRLVD